MSTSFLTLSVFVCQSFSFLSWHRWFFLSHIKFPFLVSLSFFSFCWANECSVSGENILQIFRNNISRTSQNRKEDSERERKKLFRMNSQRIFYCACVYVFFCRCCRRSCTFPDLIFSHLLSPILAFLLISRRSAFLYVPTILQHQQRCSIVVMTTAKGKSVSFYVGCQQKFIIYISSIHSGFLGHCRRECVCIRLCAGLKCIVMLNALLYI